MIYFLLFIVSFPMYIYVPMQRKKNTDNKFARNKTDDEEFVFLLENISSHVSS